MSHLVCGGVYDWSTGLLYQGGRYFDPTLGIWLALGPLVVAQAWRERKRKGRRGRRWYVLVALLVVGVGIGGGLAACGGPPEPPPVCTDLELPPAPFHTVYIHPTWEPIVTARGHFEWALDFRLENPAGQFGGWIVQKMKTDSYWSDESIDGQYHWIPVFSDFWEAWMVPAGRVESPVAGIGGDDFNGLPAWDEGGSDGDPTGDFHRHRFGKRVVTGIVRFYEVGLPRGLFGTHPLMPEETRFLRTADPAPCTPWFWEETQEGTPHNIEVVWDRELEFARATVTWGDENSPRNTKTVSSP